MNDITNELLGLVLNKEVFNIVPDKHEENIVAYLLSDGWAFTNSDTVTRLMKEWCYDQGYAIETRYNYPMQAVVIYPNGSDNEIKNGIYDGFGIGETEVEVVAKATDWVAKHKGLI